MSEETVQIRMCPHCDGTHKYKLKVERTFLMRLMNDSNMSERSRRVKITRIFVCPINNEKFQGTFYLQETSSCEIRDLKVLGPA